MAQEMFWIRNALKKPSSNSECESFLSPISKFNFARSCNQGPCPMSLQNFWKQLGVLCEEVKAVS